jgi:PD-(D/E)XK nuclease superfamily
MTDTFVEPAEAPDPIPRDGWGRPLVKPEGGGKPVAYTRCTRYVSCLEDTYNLSLWQQRMVAVGITQRPDIHLQVAALASDPAGNKKQLDQACDAAREAAAASAAATTGTALHQLTELIDRGRDVGVIPDAYTADLEAYRKATEGFKYTHIEQFCVLDRYKIGGTPDRIVKLDGKTYIADVKTGSIDWGIGKIAMQLAVYARSHTYDHTSGQRGIHGAELDKGLIIHLPAGTGTCRLHWVNLIDGWEAVMLARRVRDWRAKKLSDLTEPYARFDPLEAAIHDATSEQQLLDLWGRHHAIWTDVHTEAAVTKKAALQAGSSVA